MQARRKALARKRAAGERIRRSGVPNCTDQDMDLEIDLNREMFSEMVFQAYRRRMRHTSMRRESRSRNEKQHEHEGAVSHGPFANSLYAPSFMQRLSIAHPRLHGISTIPRGSTRERRRR
jgi:hypothetical protein